MGDVIPMKIGERRCCSALQRPAGLSFMALLADSGDDPAVLAVCSERSWRSRKRSGRAVQVPRRLPPRAATGGKLEVLLGQPWSASRTSNVASAPASPSRAATVRLLRRDQHVVAAGQDSTGGLEVRQRARIVRQHRTHQNGARQRLRVGQLSATTRFWRRWNSRARSASRSRRRRARDERTHPVRRCDV